MPEDMEARLHALEDREEGETGRWRFAERRAEIFFIAPRAEGWNRQRFIAVLAERG